MVDGKKPFNGITIVGDGEEVGKITDWKPSRKEDLAAGFSEYVEKVRDVNKFMEDMWGKEIELSTGSPSFPKQSFILKSDDCKIIMVLDGKETELEECWWESDNLVVREKDTGRVWTFLNVYAVSDKVVETG